MIRRIRVALCAAAIVALTLLCSGCIIGQYYDGSEIPADKLAQIKPGETTKGEIVEWFGPCEESVSPALASRIVRSLSGRGRPLGDSAFGNVLSFQYSRGKFKGIWLIVFNWWQIKAKSDQLVVFFDDNEKVKYYGFRRGTEEF